MSCGKALAIVRAMVSNVGLSLVGNPEGAAYQFRWKLYGFPGWTCYGDEAASQKAAPAVTAQRAVPPSNGGTPASAAQLTGSPKRGRVSLSEGGVFDAVLGLACRAVRLLRLRTRKLWRAQWLNRRACPRRERRPRAQGLRRHRR